MLLFKSRAFLGAKLLVVIIIMAGIRTGGGCSSQGDIKSLPAGLKVDAVLLLDAQLAIKQLWRLPELLMPGGVVVLCSSTSCAGDSSEMKVRQF